MRSRRTTIPTGCSRFPWATRSVYGNEYADLLTGNLSNYNETNKNRINDITYNTWEFFGQDSWKATRKLTLEFGMRFTPLHAVDRSPGTSATRSSTVGLQFGNHGVAPELRHSAALSGTPRTLRCRSEDSPRGRCSISRASAQLTMSRKRQDRSPRRMGTLLLPLRPVHQRPRCIGGCCHCQLSAQQLGRRPWLPDQSSAGSPVCGVSLLSESRRHSCFACSSRFQGRQPAVYR